MISRIIIVQHKFALTAPQSQRMLAAAKAYIDNGIKVFFIYSSCEEEIVDTLYPEIDFIRIPENGRIDLLSYYRFVKEIKSLYTKDSLILFYDVPYYSILFRHSKYHVFSEITEEPLFGKKASIIKRILAYISLTAVRGFSGIFVISQSLKEYYISKNVRNIEIINMFVDKQRFNGLTKQCTEKYVAYCGTISLYKDGVDDLIKAFNIFNKKYPEFKLLLFGKFENELVRDTLMSLVDKLNLSSNVIFTGPILPGDLPQKLVNASILALSRPANKQAQYGFPTKLGEYLATGNPVILTEVGDIPLFLTDNINSFLVNPGNYNAFAEKMIWIVEHPEAANRVALAGKQLVEIDFSSNFQIQKALNHIHRVLGV